MNKISVTNQEFEELEHLAAIVNDKTSVLICRKIARAEHFNI